LVAAAAAGTSPGAFARCAPNQNPAPAANATHSSAVPTVAVLFISWTFFEQFAWRSFATAIINYALRCHRGQTAL
jgi:hypothetical protein